MKPVTVGRSAVCLIALAFVISTLAAGCSSGSGGGGAVPNQAPSTVPDNIVTQEDTAVTFNPTANDSDPDGDFFGVTSVSFPLNGTTSLAGSMITYTPDPEFSGGEGLTYTVQDSAGNTAQGMISITVTLVNDSPIAMQDFGLVDEDDSVTVDVLMNDSDVEGDPLSIQGFSQPPNGTVTAGPGDTLIYAPNPDFCGPDGFQYSVTDGNSVSIALVTMTVACFNDPPNAVDDAAAVLENSSVDIDVLGNDVDVDGDLLSVTSITQPMNGTTQIIPGDQISYTPTGGFTGADSFTYTIEDPSAESDTATVAVTVLSSGSLAFFFSGVAQNLDYDPGALDLAFTVPFSIEEDPASGGFPNPIEAFNMSIGHDSGLLTATTVSEGADLAALGGGAGPELFMPLISDGLVQVAVVVTTVGGPFLVADGPQEAVLIEYEGNGDLLAGNTDGASTALTWTPGANDVTVGGVPATPLVTDVAIDLNPLTPGIGFHFFAPGQVVNYDLGTGVGAFTQSLFIFESVVGGGSPLETDGFTMSLMHDAGLLTAVDVREGPPVAALNGGSGPDFFAPVFHADGICVGVIYDYVLPVTLTAETLQEAILVDYETVPGALAGDADGAVAPLLFSDVLGNPPPGNNLSILGAPNPEFPTKSSGAITLLP